jgi:hypothetical protein
MKLHHTLRASVLSLAILTTTALAAPHTYQVTGPIVEISDTSISVMKGKEKWEISREAGTKITGDLKVGAKVTVEYYMTAKSAEVKADKK